jgi:large subunit ribosomal protein L6
MSRIGKLPVSLPSGVEVTVSPENEITVKGPKGSLKTLVDRDIELTQEGDTLVVSRPTEQKRHKAMHGLYRSLINNMVIGVNDGYTEQLELVGVGIHSSTAVISS